MFLFPEGFNEKRRCTHDDSRRNCPELIKYLQPTTTHIPMKSTILTIASLIFAAGLAFAAKPYTSKYCPVTDNELGSMGKVVTKVYDGQEVKFCCKPCVKKFEANPGKYLPKVK